MLVRLALVGSFFDVYLSCGARLARTGVLGFYNVLFQADTPRVVTDMTIVAGNHYRTGVHPLFVLLVNPIGSLLGGILASPLAAAVGLSAAAGAVCVGLAHLWLCRSGLTPLRAALWAIALGASASHLVFASIPETFSFAAASLVLLSLAGSEAGFVAAAILSLGMTTTNIVPAVLLRCSDATRDLRSGVRAAGLGAIAFAITIVLSIVQHRIYPSTHEFFGLEQVDGERSWMPALGGVAGVASRIVEVARTLAVFSVVGPRLRLWSQTGTPLRFLSLAPSMTTLGWVATAFWCGLVGFAASRMLRGAHPRLRTLLGFGACLLFDAMLFTVYGDDLFLYSPLWTFQLVALVATAIGPTAGGRVLDVALGAFVAALVASNAEFVQKILLVYGA